MSRWSAPPATHASYSTFPVETTYPFPYPTITQVPVERKEVPKVVPLTIGIDFGGVCSVHSERYETKDVDETELINVPGCVATLTALRNAGYKLILVSFCGAKRAAATRAYLKDKGLFNDLVFVKDRKYKASVCERFGIDVLIDDRQDILSTIAPTQSILFTYENDLAGKKTQAPKYMHIAKNWGDVLTILPNIKRLGRIPNETIDLTPLGYW